MEGGGSFRIGSSSIWRNSDAAEIFSNSFHQENDEEALKWAAIQKLPTFERLRKGLLTSLQGEATEIDVENLGLQERKDLLERLVRLAEEDNEKFLLKLKDRIDRVGIDLPTIEVRFEGLNIEAEAHVGNRSLPTFTNFMVNIVGGLLNSLHVLPSRKQHLNILKDVSGILKPSRMTLLLGPPSSGKTTLLLALAGKLDPKLKFSGKVTYNGHEMNEFVPQRTAAYVDQNDLHIGEMTVRETLAFSARVQGVGPRYDLLAELSRREKHANIMPDPDIDVYMKAIATEGQKANLITDYVLRILGLEICADTVVGNAMLRGISGGQKKRVTTGEMLVGPAKALFMDEISTGLDSSTTFQIVNSMKQFVHILKGTAVISLLQPPPETYNLFDDIILLSDSHIIYQGPREHVLEFFESIGFKCPDRKGVADFLQEVTSSKDQEQYWEHKDQPYRFVTAEEFSEAFQSFHVGRRLGDELGTEFDKSKSHPAALTTKKYGVGKRELFKACLSREYLLMKRNSFVYIFKICQICIMAMIAMTIFFRTEMHRDSANMSTQLENALVEIQIPEQKLLPNGTPFPAIVTPRTLPLNATHTIKTHKPYLESLLHHSGAILLRNFSLQTASHFNSLVEAFDYAELPYIGGAAPRTNVVGRVFTANESPPDQKIPFHHEMAQVPEFPSKLFFFCEVEPKNGGETPIVLSHVVYDRMKDRYPEFVEKLEKFGLLYVRVLGEDDNPNSPIGRGWKSTFLTQDKNIAQQRAGELGMKLEWLEDGVKTIMGPIPAVKYDEVRKRKIWFNSMVAAYTGWKDERNDPVKAVTFGDGSPLPADVVYNCLNILEEESVAIPWRKGDVMLLDNWAVLHSRRPFDPPRRVLASLVK